MLYYDWKSIGVEPAQRALNKGASIWKLPIPFGNGMAKFSYGLQTKRGSCFVISEHIFAALSVPETAWPADAAPAVMANHRSPFGPGA